MSFPIGRRLEALRAVADWYRRNGFGTRLYAGPASLEILDCEGRVLRPQLVVMEGTAIVRLVDVETAESLDAGAVLRWRLSLGGGFPLHVYVPASLFDRAFVLRTEADLVDQVRLEAYFEDELSTLEPWKARDERTRAAI